MFKNYENKDAVERAKLFEKYCENISAYADYLGIKEVREHIAQFIEYRDGHPSDYRNIFTSNGTSGGIKTLLQALIQPPDGAV
jgi:alanine transaminase